MSGRDRVLVTGLGPVGLGVALLAQRAMGAKVIGLEADPERVAFAQKLGIEALQCAGCADGNEDVEAVKTLADGEGVEVAVDCSGAAVARLTCLRAMRTWGRVVFVGEGGRVDFDVSQVVIHKSLSIYGSWVCSIAQMESLVDLLVRWNVHPEVSLWFSAYYSSMILWRNIDANAFR